MLSRLLDRNKKNMDIKTTEKSSSSYVGAFIDSLEFNDHNTIKFVPNDIIVFVGPNNVGKSKTLEEIYRKMITLKGPTIIIKDAKIISYGTNDAIAEHVKSFSKVSIDDKGYENYQGIGYNFNRLAINVYWPLVESEGLNSQIHPAFVERLTTENRLSAANPPNNIDLHSEAPHHPIHYLQLNDRIEAEFEKYFRKAFGQDFIVNRNAGKKVPIHVGIRPKLEDNEDRLTFSYLQKINQLPTLHEQGDGMRSFIGVLLKAILANSSVLLIDEPEAFLHPPQARLLGSMLGKNKPHGRQLFLSTHSIDFLKGLLDSGNKDLKVIRLDRVGNINNSHVLDKEDIQAIWSDSILRHSNILDGLFHHKVIICESDSDCRFYSAILNSLQDNEELPTNDVLFIHCGGKHRIPTVVKALIQLNVNISVVADFDILNNINPIKPLSQILEIEWTKIERDFNIVKKSIDQQRPELETSDVKSEIETILNSTNDRIFPIENAKKINGVLKKTSAWSKAKQIGKSYIPNGEESNAYVRLTKEFENKNFFIVEVGELEGFDKTIGNHGPTWVNEVLEKDLYNTSELEEARNFVRKIIN